LVSRGKSALPDIPDFGGVNFATAMVAVAPGMTTTAVDFTCAPGIVPVMGATAAPRMPKFH
jgi:hypothetical protein